MKKLEQGYSTLHCSDCGVALCEVFVYLPQPVEGEEFLPENYQIIAECPHCKDKSYKVQVQGKIAFSSTEYTKAFPEYNHDNSCIIVKTEIKKAWI